MAVMITWNMQGGNATTENKWHSSVFAMLNQGGDVLCLQECGPVPPSAQLLQAGLCGNSNFSFYYSHRYRYISFYHWDLNGNRVNLAIVSKVEPTEWRCLVPVGGPIWRPVIGARIQGHWYFSLHCISPGGADGPGLIGAIIDDLGDAPWIAGGDYNREPVPPITAPNAIAPPLLCPTKDYLPTYKMLNPTRLFDYAYCNYAVYEGTVLDLLIMSDHRAVSFGLG
ncbi:MAG: endonuclease/exonuclease/phosphatase family protein [bacterium]|nr:endonuclease/exonuclease/phosphatase family protein [bacterium]